MIMGHIKREFFYAEDEDAENITIEELLKLLEEEKQRQEKSGKLANRERLNDRDELDLLE